MKKLSISILAICLLIGVGLVGCSGSEDGPSFSEDELLKRGRAGREAATQGSKTPPSSTTTGTTGQ